jgi:hypothetical protein
MSLQEVTDYDAQGALEVRQQKGQTVAVVAFVQKGCSLSQQMAGALEEFADEFPGVAFLEAEVDSAMLTALKFGAHGIPSAAILELREDAIVPMKCILGFEDKPRLRADLRPWLQ